MTANVYSKLVFDATGWRGAYELVIPIKVGDYFQIGDNGVPIGLGNVFNWPGWAHALPVDTETIAGSETYYSGCARQFDLAASGGITPPSGLGADATVELSFSKSAGFALAYDAAKRSRMREVAKAQHSVLELAMSQRWQEDWVLVTEVIEAASATLVVATEAESLIKLHANVALPLGLAAVGIANPALGWTASSWRGSGYTSLCKAGTPLFHCVKARKNALRRWRAELLADQQVNYDAVFTDDPYDAAENG